MLLLAALTLCSAAAASFPGAPIWSSNASSFALLRAPEFTLRAPPLRATLHFAALGSPGTQGTLQAKLLGAACPHLNGVLLTCGPGHNIPTDSQLIRAVDLLPYLRTGAPNALGIAAFYNVHARSGASEPRVQAWVEVVDASGSYTLAPTGSDWASPLNGDAIFNPTGSAGIAWYFIPNEDLDRRAYPLGWAEPGFAAPWPPAALQPAFTAPLYQDDAAPAPVPLQRHACAVATLAPGHQVLDYGQEMMGGVNLTFAAGAPAGTRVTVTLGEVLRADGSVLSPMTTGNNFNSTWTLSGQPALDARIVQHEFIQFRYAEVRQWGAGPFEHFTPDTALAWVLQHPLGGTGENPWEQPCARSTPAAALWGAPGAAPPATPLGAFASSSAPLDTVFNFSAYTMAATAMDVNVDGQTRERDVDIVDSLINARGQYALFSPGDDSIAERTLREAFTNDTGMWSQWYDFKASTAMYARDHSLYTGNLAPLRDFYCNTSRCIAVPPASTYNSLQFHTGLEYYFNATGSGLMAFPANGSCKGSWSCEVLLDWPTSTRDGYDASAANSEDTARSALGAMAIQALADAAGWVGAGGDAARYGAAAAALRAALLRHNLRLSAAPNGTALAWFVDGRVGPAAAHAAVHSTLFACSAGACDGLNVSTTEALVRYLVAHGVAPSSCMMGRWWVEALYSLGWVSPAGADAALGVLTSPSYPSWLDMMAQGATTTMEAWRPKDKSNLDWAHPWCASPAFTIQQGTLGARPLEPGWARWRLAPQPSDLATLAASVPTPGGVLPVRYWGATEPGVAANATVALAVAAGQGAQVCLALPGSAASVLQHPSVDGLEVDGVQGVPTVGMGRFLCTAQDLGPGQHTVARLARV